MLGQGGPSGPPLSPVVLEAVYGRQRLTRLAGLLESGQGGASSGASGFPVSQPDADETAFWNSTLIVMPKGANVPPLRPSGTRSFSSALSQAEVVNRAVQILAGAPQFRPNVLALGYRRLRGENSLAMFGAPSVENYYPNTLVNHVQGPLWEKLLTRCGPDFMLFLLTECDVFVELANACYFQLAGYPSPELLGSGPAPEIEGLAWLSKSDEAAKNVLQKRKLSDDGPQPPQRKRRKHAPRKDAVVVEDKEPANNPADDQQPKAKVFRRTPASLFFGRSNMFYARASYGYKGNVWTGLPRHHIMNKCEAGTQAASDVITKIFPRHFGHSNVFTSENLDPKQANFAAWGVPDGQTKSLAPCKIPPCLKGFVTIWNTILRRHRGSNYRALLDFHCPRPSSKGTAGNLLHLASPIGRVVRFVRSIVKRIFPIALWGSEANQRLILAAIDRFLRLGRFETMSLHDFLQGLKLGDLSWAGAAKAKNLSKDAHHLRFDLASEWIWWLVEGFLIPVVRTCFYVTESSSHKNQLLYYRQDEWLASVQANIGNVQKTFARVDHTKVLSNIANRPLAFSYVRLLPKETGMRPIVNLRRRFSKNEIIAAFRKKRDNVPPQALQMLESKLPTIGSSINNILAPPFQVLTFEKSRSEDNCAGAVLGYTDIYLKVKEFKEALRSRFGNLPPLYFAKVDITQAFDTIDQDRLVKIIREAVGEDEYVIQKYGVLFPSAGRIRRSFVKKARAASDFTQFPTHAKEMATNMRNAVFVDQVVYNFEDKDDVLYLIEEHILNNFVKLGNKFYRQNSGVAQGSVLSTLLCNFFYADLVRTKLTFVITPEGLLMRFVDDFIYISIDKALVAQFVRTMHAGFPDYGCRINPSKTLVNFELEIGGTRVNRLPEHAEFPWCGHLIDTATLDFHADYARLFGTDIKDTITRESMRRSGTMLLTKLMQFLKPRNHALYLDTALNSTETVLRNVFENFTVSAMKLIAFLRQDTPPNPSFLFRAIHSAVRFGLILARSRTSNATAKSQNSKFNISGKDVEWLGWQAFLHCFGRKQARYPEICSLVAEKEKEFRSHASKSALTIAKQPVLTQIRF